MAAYDPLIERLKKRGTKLDKEAIAAIDHLRETIILLIPTPPKKRQKK